MTSVVDQDPFTQHTGNGVATVFGYEFQLLAAGDLVVSVDGATVPTSDYVVSGVGVQSGGDVTFTTAPADGASVLLSREVDLQRDTDYQYAGDFQEAVVDRDFNRLWQALQDMRAVVRGGYRFKYPNQAQEIGAPLEMADRLLTHDDVTGQPKASDFTHTQVASLIASFYAVPPSYSADAVLYLPAGIGAVPRSVQDRLRDCKSVRDFGVVGNGVADDTAGLQAAIDAAALAGVGLDLTYGTFRITSTLMIPGGLNWMFGHGAATIIVAESCNAFEFTNQSVYAGSRIFSNFFLQGSTASSYSGIYAQMTVASGHRVTSVEFSNITIQGFGYTINTAGLWNCTFRNVFGYANHQGVRLWNRNINTKFLACSFIKGTSPGGAGTRYGVLLAVDSGYRPESTIITGGSYIYGWDIGVAVGNALFTVIDGCDIDACATYGVQVTTANGGCAVRNSWINMLGGAACTAVKLDALGAAIYDSVVVEGNQITCSTPFAGTIGVAVGVNQGAARVLDNRISGFDVGIDGDAANFVERDNTINATTTAIVIDSAASVNNRIGPSYIQSGTALAFSSGSAQPAGLMYWAKGQFTMALTGCTAGVNATVDWQSVGSTVTLAMSADATGTSNATTMTGTGMPQAIRPAANKSFQAICVDNAAGSIARAVVAAASGVITFSKDVDGGAFTNTGTKGLRQSTLIYDRG